MSMSLFFPIDESLTDPTKSRRFLALLGPPKTCKSSLAFGIALKLLGEDFDANRQNTNVIMFRPRRFDDVPLKVHHMPIVDSENRLAHRLVISTVKSFESLLDYSARYHEHEQRTIPRAFILDELDVMAENHHYKSGKLYDSQTYVFKIISNFMDLTAYYSNKFDVPCYVIVTANDDVRADVGCCVPVCKNLMSTVIHIEFLHKKDEEIPEDEIQPLTSVDVVKFRMRDISNGYIAYFKIEDLEIFYERLNKVR